MCSCPLGMELGADNKTCQIQSFCAKHLKCSQKCEQEKSSVKCSCYEGWELESDMESCKSTGKNNIVSSIFPLTLLYTLTDASCWLIVEVEISNLGLLFFY